MLACLVGVHHAPLLVTHEERRLLIDECDESDGQRRLDADEQARNFEKGRNAARIIIGTWTANHRIVVHANQEDFALARASTARNFEI